MSASVIQFKTERFPSIWNALVTDENFLSEYMWEVRNTQGELDSDSFQRDVLCEETFL